MIKVSHIIFIYLKKNHQAAICIYSVIAKIYLYAMLLSLFSSQKISSSTTLSKKFSYTSAISRETSGENLKEECVTQLATASQKSQIYFTDLTKL